MQMCRAAHRSDVYLIAKHAKSVPTIIHRNLSLMQCETINQLTLHSTEHATIK